MEGYSGGEAFDIHPWGDPTILLFGELQEVLWSMTICEDDDVVIVGNVPQVAVGDTWEVTGKWGVTHDLVDLLSFHDEVDMVKWEWMAGGGKGGGRDFMKHGGRLL